MSFEFLHLDSNKEWGHPFSTYTQFSEKTNISHLLISRVSLKCNFLFSSNKTDSSKLL